MADSQKIARRKRANEARLNAIQQKVKRDEIAQSQIKKALLSLDEQNKSSTHIKFSDSDDSDDAEVITGTTETVKLATVKSKSDKLLGFDEDDSSENEIEIKPQFEGKHGEKLLELQSGYGNDKRFRLDKRFAEDDDSDKDEGIDIDISLKRKDELEDTEGELQKNLKLLNQVIGHDVTQDDKTKRKTEKFMDVSSRRYDPSKGEHLEIKPKKKEVTSTKKKKKKKKEEPAQVVEVDSKKFYETSTNVLKDAFASKSENNSEVKIDASDKQQTEPFSFLSMLGRKEEDDNAKGNNNKHDYDYEEMEIDKDSRFEMTSSMKKDIPTLKNKFKYDSSDTEDEIDDVQDGENEINDENMFTYSKESAETPKTNPNHPTTFFMTSSTDPRIIDGIKLFCWNKSFEEVQREFLEVKDTLVKDYKKKHRDAKRKERKAKYESKLVSSTTNET